MESPQHALKDLFDQLGLPSTSADIERFVATHRPLPDTLALAEAPFWSAAQARFLREEIDEDADWAELVDHLDAMLRG